MLHEYEPSYRKSKLWSPTLIEHRNLPKPRLKEFETNSALDQLTQNLSSAVPNWSQINEEYKSSWRKGPRRIYLGAIAEIFLQTEIKKASENSNGKIIINPIPEGFETENYRFLTDINEQSVPVVRTTGLPYSEYDLLTRIDGLIVAWDIKNTKIIDNVDNAIDPNLIKKRLAPLREYCGDEPFGYAVVAKHKGINQNSFAQKQFRENGGILVPLMNF